MHHTKINIANANKQKHKEPGTRHVWHIIHIMKIQTVSVDQFSVLV